MPRSFATLVGMARSTNGTPSRSATAGPTTEPAAPYVAEIVTTCMRGLRSEAVRPRLSRWVGQCHHGEAEPVDDHRVSLDRDAVGEQRLGPGRPVDLDGGLLFAG